MNAPATIETGDSFSKVAAAWLPLVPRQISTGDRTILGKISKRGNRYLRALFVQGAWVVLVKAKPSRLQGHGLKPWIEAAKLARIAWSVLVRGRAFKASRLRDIGSNPVKLRTSKCFPLPPPPGADIEPAPAGF